MMFFSYSLHAQFINELISFESPDSLLRIDNTLPGNIWQIGTPQKVFFDSAYSVPNAIVTDLVHPYPPLNFSAFILKVSDSNAVYYMRESINFLHKFDTDSLHDGGYIEVSYDGGTTWTNIANDPYIHFYYNPDQMTNPVIANGNAAYTGRSVSNYGQSNGWRWDGIYWCYEPQIPSPVYLRFVFSSDTVQTNKEGWMLDDIDVISDICEGINEQADPALISLSPNPASDKIMISRKNINSEGDIMIYNGFGKICFLVDHFGGDIIDVSSFPSGIYILQYSDSHSYTLKKFIVIR